MERPLSPLAHMLCKYRSRNGRIRHFSAPARARCGASGALRAQLPSARAQPVPRHVQVRQRKERHHLRRVLHQSPVAGLYITELALDHPQGVLHLGTDLCLDLFELPQARPQGGGGQRTALARPQAARPSRPETAAGACARGPRSKPLSARLIFFMASLPVRSPQCRCCVPDRAVMQSFLSSPASNDTVPLALLFHCVAPAPPTTVAASPPLKGLALRLH